MRHYRQEIIEQKKQDITVVQEIKKLLLSEKYDNSRLQILKNQATLYDKKYGGSRANTNVINAVNELLNNPTLFTSETPPI